MWLVLTTHEHDEMTNHGLQWFTDVLCSSADGRMLKTLVILT